MNQTFHLVLALSIKLPDIPSSDMTPLVKKLLKEIQEQSVVLEQLKIKREQLELKKELLDDSINY